MQLDVSTTLTGKDSPLCQHKRPGALRMSNSERLQRNSCCFIAKLIEHRTYIAEITGSNPVEALIFSGFFFPIA